VSIRGRLRLFGLALAAASPLVAAVEPPIPLRTPPPMVPEETAGSGLAPEARVRISIDARGAVAAVEVLTIEPVTENDALYRAELVETLSRWRYAPQRRDGVPEPTRLEWRVRFPAREAADAAPAPGGGPLATLALAGADAESRRSRILALPDPQRLALLSAQVATARALLAPGRTREASTDHVVVYSDADEPETAAKVAGNVEAIFRTLALELLPGIAQLPERLKLQVVAYRSRSSYAALLGAMPFYEWSAGFYSPAGLIAFHLEQPTSDAATSLLLHEATHAFLDRHIVRRGVALPRWLGEGFADYVGNSEIRKGRLVPGRTVRGRYELWRGGISRIDTGGGLQIDRVKQALKKGRGLSVPELLESTPETFYGEDRELFYGSAWLLVHFLRDGSPGWAAERFPNLLLYLAEGYPAASAVRTLYGAPAGLDAAFRDYVKDF